MWRNRPQQAKFQGREHFGKLYEIIFTDDLNAAQTVIATLLYRSAENKRRRPPSGSPEFIAYASCFLAMLMGHYLLAELAITLAQLDHRNFAEAKRTLEKHEDAYHARAVEAIADALKRLYGEEPVSLQRLAATFRRGDLMEFMAVRSCFKKGDGQATTVILLARISHDPRNGSRQSSAARGL